jgi:hypothetical protein
VKIVGSEDEEAPEGGAKEVREAIAESEARPTSARRTRKHRPSPGKRRLFSRRDRANLNLLVWGSRDNGKTALLWAIGQSFRGAKDGDISFHNLDPSFAEHWVKLDDRRQRGWVQTNAVFDSGDFEGGEFVLFRPTSRRMLPRTLGIRSIDVPGEAILDALHLRAQRMENQEVTERARELLDQADAALLVIRGDMLESPRDFDGVDPIGYYAFIKASLAELGSLGIPVAVVVTAIDALRDVVVRDAVLDHSLAREQRSEWIRTLVEKYVDEIDATLSGCSDVEFFGVSAFGREPDTHENAKVIPDAKPEFVKEPVLWVIRRVWGVMTRQRRAARRRRRSRLFMMAASLLAFLPLAVGEATRRELSGDLRLSARPELESVTALLDSVRNALPGDNPVRETAASALYVQAVDSGLGDRDEEADRLLERLQRVDGAGYLTSRAWLTVLLHRFEREMEGGDVVIAVEFLSESLERTPLDAYSATQVRSAIAAGHLERVRAADAVAAEALADLVVADALLAIEYGVELSSDFVASALEGARVAVENDVAIEWGQILERIYECLPAHQRNASTAAISAQCRAIAETALASGDSSTLCEVLGLARLFELGIGDPYRAELERSMVVALETGLVDDGVGPAQGEALAYLLAASPSLLPEDRDLAESLYEGWVHDSRLDRALLLMAAIDSNGLATAERGSSLFDADRAFYETIASGDYGDGVGPVTELWRNYEKALNGDSYTRNAALLFRFRGLVGQLNARFPGQVALPEIAAGVSESRFRQIVGDDAAWEALEATTLVRLAAELAVSLRDQPGLLETSLTPMLRHADTADWELEEHARLVSILIEVDRIPRQSLINGLLIDLLAADQAIRPAPHFYILASLGPDPRLGVDDLVDVKVNELLDELSRRRLDRDDEEYFIRGLVEFAKHWTAVSDQTFEKMGSERRSDIGVRLLEVVATQIASSDIASAVQTFDLASALLGPECPEGLILLLDDRAVEGSEILVAVQLLQPLLGSTALDSAARGHAASAAARWIESQIDTSVYWNGLGSEEVMVHRLLGMTEASYASLSWDCRRVLGEAAQASAIRAIETLRFEDALGALERMRDFRGRSIQIPQTLRSSDLGFAEQLLELSTRVSRDDPRSEWIDGALENVLGAYVGGWSTRERPLSSLRQLKESGRAAFGGRGWSPSAGLLQGVYDLLRDDSERLGDTRDGLAFETMLRDVQVLWGPGDADRVEAELVLIASEAVEASLEGRALTKKLELVRGWPGSEVLEGRFVVQLVQRELLRGDIDEAASLAEQHPDRAVRGELRQFLESCRGLVLIVPEDAEPFLVMPGEVTRGEYAAFVREHRDGARLAELAQRCRFSFPDNVRGIDLGLLLGPLDGEDTAVDAPQTPIHRVSVAAAGAFALAKGMELPTKRDLLHIWGDRKFPWGETWRADLCGLRTGGGGVKVRESKSASSRQRGQIPVQRPDGPSFVGELVGNVAEIAAPSEQGGELRGYGGSTIVSATPSEVESWRSETNLIRTPRLEWREGYPFVGFRCVLRLPSVLKLGDSPIRDDAEN